MTTTTMMGKGLVALWCTLLVCTAPLWEGVQAHGQLTYPVPRPDVNGLTVSSGQREPVRACCVQCLVPGPPPPIPL